jgi:16S rRNA (uracil1498-N3)-methyltransferase
VERFFPLLLDRCVARPHGAGAKEDRWHRLAVESLKQSRRARLMRVEAPLDLDTFLEQLPSPADLWFGDPGGVAPPPVVPPQGEGPLVLLVGPEGGLAPGEVERLQDRGGIPIRLGGNRLRAETAGMALIVGALTVGGELGPARR